MATIIGVFPRRDDARRLVEELRTGGIREDNINSVLVGEEVAEAQEKEAGTAQKAGAAAGAGALAVAGVASLLIPYLGPMIAAGPIAAALGVGASADAPHAEVMRHLEQALEHVGFDPSRASAYAHHLSEGQSLVSVEVPDDQTNIIADIFHRNGGSGLDYQFDNPESLPEQV